eukprot:scaffold22493_cov33-Phaeocystis_antarctica.AAC.1
MSFCNELLPHYEAHCSTSAWAYVDDPVVHYWASLNVHVPPPRGWELGGPVRTEEITVRRRGQFYLEAQARVTRLICRERTPTAAPQARSIPLTSCIS